MTGSKSLKVDANTKIGGSIKAALGSKSTFVMKGFFFDTMCEGVHFISPDGVTCSTMDNAKIDGDIGSAHGVYSSSSPEFYTFSTP